jgi:hypothetical protein
VTMESAANALAFSAEGNTDSPSSP